MLTPALVKGTVKVELTSDDDLHPNEIADEALPNRRTLTNIPGYSEKPSAWREGLIIDIYNKVACSSNPWESPLLTDFKFLQQLFKKHYPDTSGQVGPRGSAYQAVSPCSDLLTSMISLAQLTIRS